MASSVTHNVGHNRPDLPRDHYAHTHRHTRPDLIHTQFTSARDAVVITADVIHLFFLLLCWVFFFCSKSEVSHDPRRKERDNNSQTEENWDTEIILYKSRQLFIFTFCIWICPTHQPNLPNYRHGAAPKSNTWHCIKSSCFRISENRSRSRHVLGPPGQKLK